MPEKDGMVERVLIATDKEAIWIRRTESFENRERSTLKALSDGCQG
jgi:hypothetical protein